jgi:hypothetical protein
MRRKGEVAEGDERDREAVVLDETPCQLCQWNQVAGERAGQQYGVRPLGAGIDSIDRIYGQYVLRQASYRCLIDPRKISTQI